MADAETDEYGDSEEDGHGEVPPDLLELHEALEFIKETEAEK